MQEGNNSSDQESQKINQDFKRLKNEIDQAKKILSDLEDFSKKFQSLRDLLDNEDDGIETNLDWVKRSAKESENLKKASEEHLSSISEKITSIKEKINFMDKAHEEFLVIQGKIGERTQTIEGFTSTSEGLKNDIERIKQDSQSKLSEIGNLLDSVKNKIAEMDGAYHDFLGIKGKIEDENHGLSAMLRFVEEIKEKSVGLRNEITSFYDQSKNYLKDIRSNHETSNDLKTKIQKNLDDSNGIKQQVQEVADLVVDTGFVNSFQKRAKALLDNYKLWRLIFLGSVILLALLLWLLFGSFDSIPDAKVILFRITLTSPLLFLIYFSASQYSKERDLNEKYEFKAVTAAAVRNHVKFLTDEFENDSDEGSSKTAEDFAVNVFKMIYKEPYHQSDSRKKLQKIDSRIKELEKGDKTQNKIGIKEAVDSIEYLKSLIPDQESFKKVVEFLTKKLR
jgi:hypothetical protein